MAIVLLSPLGFSPTGEAFNLAMEDLATSAAIALRAEKLIFLTQNKTVFNEDGSVDTELAREDADKLLAAGTLDEDTSSFLTYASRAVKRGVARAHLVPYTLDGSVLLDLKAKSAEVAYDRLKMVVDAKLMLPRTIEAYAASGILIKTLRFSNVKDFGGGIRRPATLVTDSPLHKGYTSTMQWSGLKRANFPDEVFTLNGLPRVQELRK